MNLDKDLRSIQEVRDLVKAAKSAQKEYSSYTQERVDEIVKKVAFSIFERSEELAKMANEETGFGKWQDKIIKNQFASKGVYEYIKDMKTIGIINEDKQQKMIEIATPVGVVAGLVPSTNPTSTAIYKSLIALKSGNAIVLSAHPSALKSIVKTIMYIREELKRLDVPVDLVSVMQIPTMEATDALMKNNDIALILATGGSAMVKAAYSSGNPALGVGPGNVPSFIEKTADIKDAVRKIIESKTFDNGVICASEQSIVVESCISEEVRSELKRSGCYFVNTQEKIKLERIIQRPNGTLNASIVGKSAVTIAQMAGIDVPQDTKILLADEIGVGIDYPFSREKLCPILAFYVEPNAQSACEKCIELLDYEGKGHSLSIHTKDESIVKEFALKKPVSRILVNAASAQAGIGATTAIASALTLGCGAIGGSATSDNVTPMHLFNIRRVAYGIKEVSELRFESNNQIEESKTSLEDIIKKVIMEINSK